MGCLGENILSAYLDKALSGAERHRIEKHVSGCNHCLELLLVAYDAQCGLKRCPPALKEKMRKHLGLKQKKTRPEMKWLAGTLILFALSFAFRRYFLQFLVAAAILGFIWAMEGEGAKRVVMIFKGMKDEEKDFERKAPPPVSHITGGDRYGEGR